MVEFKEHFYSKTNFSSGIKSLLGFAQCKTLPSSWGLEAVQLMLSAAAHLSTTNSSPSDGGDGNKEKVSKEDVKQEVEWKASKESWAGKEGEGWNKDSEDWVWLWFPLLRWLSMLIWDDRKDIRTR